MQRLAVILEFSVSPGNLFHSFEYFDPSRLIIYCKPAEKERYRGLLENAARLGIEIVDVDAGDTYYETASCHQYYFAAISYMYGQLFSDDSKLFAKEFNARYRIVQYFKGQGKKFICDNYSIDDLPSERQLTKGVYYLGPYEESVVQGLDNGEAVCDQAGGLEMGWSPGGAELATVGITRATEKMLELSRRDKGELQRDLARHINADFKPDRPILLYMVANGCESPCVDRGLLRLAKYFNVVVRGKNSDYCGDKHGFNSVTSLSGHRDIFYAPDTSTDRWLTRFAVDVILGSPFGGGFYTNFLLNLRQIIIHTNRVQSSASPIPQNFTNFFRDQRLLWPRLAQNLPPINIEATDMLVDLIRRKDYWEKYDREIAGLVRRVLGRTWFGREACLRYAKYITRVLDRGSFAPQPHELPGFTKIKGPLIRETPAESGFQQG